MRPNRTLIFATICSLTCCQIGLANDIFVNSVSTGGSKDGSSWEDAFLFVHDGLNAASAGDTVHVAEGVYYADEGFLIPVDSREFSFTLPEDTTLLGGYDISGQNRDPDTFLTILSGDVTKDDLDSDGNQIAETATQLVGNNAIHVVVIPAAGVVDGFVITAGQANESALSFGSSGGGLLTTGKGATVRNCQFAGNTASGRGGAVMASDADTQFINCSFYGNVAGARGGAFGTLDGATPHLINCVFSGNQSQRGGALNFNDSEPVLTNCSISGNSGTVNGGGIQAAVNSVVTLENTIVWNNLANGSASAGGSSINLISSSTSSVTTCLIENSGGSDPMFVTPPDPALAPSPTGNLQLMRGSPATEAGTDELNTEPFDFAGEDRIFGTGIDIGAFEFSPQIFVDQSATGANNGSSWKDAYTKLQDGLAVAAPEDQVRVAAGIYYPDEGIGQTDNDRESSFEIGSGVSLLGGYPNGGGSSNASIHLTVLSGDLQKNDVNLDGNRIAEDTAQLIGDNAYSVVTVDGVEDVVISGFTITAGLADEAGRGRDSGAGIYGFESDIRVMDCRMIGNLAKFSGGGITVSGSLPAELQLIRCEFISNGVNVGAGSGVAGVSSPARN